MLCERLCLDANRVLQWGQVGGPAKEAKVSRGWHCHLLHHAYSLKLPASHSVYTWAWYMQKASTFRESAILNHFKPTVEMWDKSLFPTKALPESSYIWSSPPPNSWNALTGTSPLSPQGQPRLWGRSQGARPWPTAGMQAVEKISFVLQYYANKQIKLSTWDFFFLIKGFD